MKTLSGSRGSTWVLRCAMTAFVITFVVLALVERERERDEHDVLRRAFIDQASQLEAARAELHGAREAMRHDSGAFRGLLSSHEELQALHRASMDWGPLRAPRDCVREVILIDATAWPEDRDAQLAYHINGYDWCEGERTRLVEDLDKCDDMCFPHPSQRTVREDPRVGDSDSSSIDWSLGHEVEPPHS